MKLTTAGLILTALALASAATLSAPVLRHETTTLNIEVPVRVFKGDRFVDDLTISDFEVYEDGRLQSLDAVYLVRKTAIERREEAMPFVPDTQRHFYLDFELSEYDPRIREALDYFVREVLLPGEQMVLLTPMRTYRMHGDVF